MDYWESAVDDDCIILICIFSESRSDSSGSLWVPTDYAQHLQMRGWVRAGWVLEMVWGAGHFLAQPVITKDQETIGGIVFGTISCVYSANPQLSSMQSPDCFLPCCCCCDTVSFTCLGVFACAVLLRNSTMINNLETSILGFGNCCKQILSENIRPHWVLDCGCCAARSPARHATILPRLTLLELCLRFKHVALCHARTVMFDQASCLFLF